MSQRAIIPKFANIVPALDNSDVISPFLPVVYGERDCLSRVEIKSFVLHITEPAGWCFYVHSSQLPVYFQIYLNKILCLSPKVDWVYECPK